MNMILRMSLSQVFCGDKCVFISCSPCIIITGGVVESLDRSSYELYDSCRGSIGVSSLPVVSLLLLVPLSEQ